MRRGERLKWRGGQDAGHFPTERGVEAGAGRAVVGVGEHEATVGEVAAEGLQFGRSERREVPLAPEVKERKVEEPRVEPQWARLRHHLHRGPPLELPGDAA